MFAFKIVLLISIIGIYRSVNATFINCGGTSLHRTLTFKTPTKIPETCVYKFKPPSSRVCKIKFEFNTFSLAPPRENPFPDCVDDVMETDEIKLCGYNSQQHIYLTYPASRVITLNFRLLNRTGTIIPNPDWNIKMTQMDCDQNKIDLPPPFCLQYYSGSNGVIESFNFRGGQYIGNTSYAICIRKPNPNSDIRISSSVFEMAYVTDINNGLDTDCLPNAPNPASSEDHLYIPGAVLTDGGNERRAYAFCHNSLRGATVTSTTPGPFVMYFNSDVLYNDQKPETGFSLFYNII